MDLRILTALVINAFVAIIIFLAMSSPLAGVFDMIQDQANDTLGTAPNVNATTMAGHFDLYRGILGFYCLLAIVSVILYYAISRFYDQQEEYRG